MGPSRNIFVVTVIALWSQGYCFRDSRPTAYLYLSSTSFPLLQDAPEVPLQTSLASLHPPWPQGHDPEPTTRPPPPSRGPALPPIRESLYIVIPMTLIYSVIFLTGLIGNISTCIVISRTRILHSATNYYLFSLSISDLLLLLSGLPQEMYSIWVRYPYIFGEAFCIIRGVAAEASANATVLTITAFTVERYVAICHPLRSHKLSQLTRVVRIIISIWIVALALALPQAARFGLVDEMDDGVVVIEGAWCSIKREFIPYAFEISICVFFVIPMTIITALYVLIGMKLRKSRRGPSNVNQELTVEPYRYAHARHSQTHVIRMLVSVVVAFFVCWAPFHCQRLLAIYAQGTQSRTLVAIYDLITHASGILYYLSTCINPVLYNIMSNKFRQAFKDTLTQTCSKRRTRGPHHRTYSLASNRSSRMGVGLAPNHYLGQSLRRFDTCLNCRHTPSMCSCRGSSRKFVRNYSSPIPVETQPLAVCAVDSSISVSPYRNNSSAEVNIPLASLPGSYHSQGPAAIKPRVGTMSGAIRPRRGGIRILFVEGGRKKNRFLRIIQRKRNPSDPCCGDPKLIEQRTAIGRKRRAKSYDVRPNVKHAKGHGVTQGHQRDWGEYSGRGSVNSESSISNSSLQDLDETEFTSEELAVCLAEMKQALQYIS